MSAVKITKVMYHCKCEASHKDGTPCAYEWEPEDIPLRCPKCKSRRWNRPARILGKTSITFKGETMNVSQWSKKLGLAKTTIPWRMAQGWPLEQVLSEDDWRKQ